MLLAGSTGPKICSRISFQSWHVAIPTWTVTSSESLFKYTLGVDTIKDFRDILKSTMPSAGAP
jgi:hypothetical protein